MTVLNRDIWYVPAAAPSYLPEPPRCIWLSDAGRSGLRVAVVQSIAEFAALFPKASLEDRAEVAQHMMHGASHAMWVLHGGEPARTSPAPRSPLYVLLDAYRGGRTLGERTFEVTTVAPETSVESLYSIAGYAEELELVRQYVVGRGVALDVIHESTGGQ